MEVLVLKGLALGRLTRKKKYLGVGAATADFE
jgi:hypothetical protein